MARSLQEVEEKVGTHGAIQVLARTDEAKPGPACMEGTNTQEKSVALAVYDR